MKIKSKIQLFKLMALIQMFGIVILFSNPSLENIIPKTNYKSEETWYYLIISKYNHLEYTVNLDFNKWKNRLKFNKSYSKNLKYKLIVLINIILLCGDVEINPGPNYDYDFNVFDTNKIVIAMPSTSSGIYKDNIQNRDERFMRPYFTWKGSNSSIDDSQSSITENNISYSQQKPVIKEYRKPLSKTNHDDHCSIDESVCSNTGTHSNSPGMVFHLNRKYNDSQCYVDNNNKIYNPSFSKTTVGLSGSNFEHPYNASYCSSMENEPISFREDKYTTCLKCNKRYTKRAIIIHNKQCNKQNETNIDFEINCSRTNNKSRKESTKLNVNKPKQEDNIEDHTCNKCVHCGKIFNNSKGLRIHIAKVHHDVKRKEIIAKYKDNYVKQRENPLTPNQVDNSDPPTEQQKSKKYQDEKLTNKINEWLNKFSSDMDDETFCLQVSEFMIFLADIVHQLPGPKHPARKYYELRKKKKEVLQSRTYKMSSNPMRMTKNDRKRRKEKYQYEVIQHEYYNIRKRAVRKIMGNEYKGCNLKIQDLYNHFYQRFNLPNNNKLKKYPEVNEKHLDEINTAYIKIIDKQEVDLAVSRIKIDTSPGSDHILMRAIKVNEVTKILSLIFSNMHTRNTVPECLKKARTILLDKGGITNEVSNWRPVSICSVVRRIYEKILDKRLKNFITFNEVQKGFVNKAGTYINANILDNILMDAKKNKQDCCILILDIEKAYDNVGHEHISAVLNSLPVPTVLNNNIQNLIFGNTTHIETSLGKTKSIEICRGVLQGAPLSPTLFNLSINHILDEFSEPNVSETYGYKLDNSLAAINILSFADDTVLVAKDRESALIMYDMISDHFQQIGLRINAAKTKIINISKGQLKSEVFICENNEITSINHNETIKYLGVNFQNEIVFNKEEIIKSVSNKLEKLASTPFLKSMQKLFVLNNYIWPTLIYPLQCAPLNKLSMVFLNDVDLVFRSGIKEILELPNDFPSSILYSPKDTKGMGIIKVSWEAYLQHINICKVLLKENNKYISKYKRFDEEIQDCLIKLKLKREDTVDIQNIKVKTIRKQLQEEEFKNWCALPQKGRGATLFQECIKINKKMNNLDGLTDSEFKDYLKMIGDVAPVRGIKGRSKDGNRCRHCSTNENFSFESLPHVLGQCSFGSLIRIERHNRIRTIIANEFRKKPNLEVFEEVTSVADKGSIRRCDIIIIDKSKQTGMILDPTVRFETSSKQPEEINYEKNQIYGPTIDYYKSKFKIKDIEIIGLLIGSRGTIPKFFSDFWINSNLPKSKLYEISLLSLKSSISILRNHLYNSS